MNKVQKLINIIIYFQFLYRFKVEILFLNGHGHIKGTVKDFKTNIKFSFNFDEYKAKVDEIKANKMGWANKSDWVFWLHIIWYFRPITITLGNGYFAKVANILLKYVTEYVHPMVETIVRKTIEIGTQTVVHLINKEIHQFQLNSNNTCY